MSKLPTLPQEPAGDDAMPDESVKKVIRFLEDNEQYGDNWETEIKALQSLLRRGNGTNDR